jgi:cytochrome c biogenesis protein CcmG/thiol:disulfide interchange protein DsbE
MRSMRLLKLTVAVLALASVAVACTHGAPEAGVPVVRATNPVTAPLLPTNVMALPSTDFGSFHELLRQLDGTPVVVNVWASWCVPCQHEAPLLVQAAKTYAGRVQFLGLDVKDARPSAQQFLRQYGVTYPSLYDAPGAVQHSLGFFAQPDTVFYDASGRVVQKVPGPLDEHTLRAGIQKILPTGNSGAPG